MYLWMGLLPYFLLMSVAGKSESITSKMGKEYCGYIHFQPAATGTSKQLLHRVVVGPSPVGFFLSFWFRMMTFEGLEMLRWDYITDYPKVLFSLESFWTAADSVPCKAFSGTNPLGFCPHRCIPGMPCTGLRKIIWQPPVRSMNFIHN